MSATAQTVAAIAGGLPRTQIDHGASAAQDAVPGQLLAAAALGAGAVLSGRVQALDDACTAWVSNLRGAMDTYEQVDRDAAARVPSTGPVSFE